MLLQQSPISPYGEPRAMCLATWRMHDRRRRCVRSRHTKITHHNITVISTHGRHTEAPTHRRHSTVHRHTCSHTDHAHRHTSMAVFLSQETPYCSVSHTQHVVPSRMGVDPAAPPLASRSAGRAAPASARSALDQWSDARSRLNIQRGRHYARTCICGEPITGRSRSHWLMPFAAGVALGFGSSMAIVQFYIAVFSREDVCRR